LFIVFVSPLRAEVINGGFEIYEPTSGGLPNTFGDWKGDLSDIVVAENGIQPFEGAQMLRFKGAAWSGHNGGASQVYQIIDTSSCSDTGASEELQYKVSAYFNRVKGDLQTDSAFRIDVFAFEGEPSGFPANRSSANWLDSAGSSVNTDDDPGTWEPVSVYFKLPPNTDYIAVEIGAYEDIFNDRGAGEFDGHYADAVEFSCEPTVTPFTAFTINKAVVLFRTHSSSRDSFKVKGEATLGTDSDGIDLNGDDVEIITGTASFVLQAGSFVAIGSWFKFEGVVSDAHVEMWINETSPGVFKFSVEVRRGDLTGTSNPLQIKLTIGNDTGTAEVRQKGALWFLSKTHRRHASSHYHM
jgi:hypothetical protein